MQFDSRKPSPKCCNSHVERIDARPQSFPAKFTTPEGSNGKKEIEKYEEGGDDFCFFLSCLYEEFRKES